MRVLFITSDHFMTARLPGSAIYLLDQASALRVAGHHVTIISVGLITARYLFNSYPYKEEEVISGVNILRAYRRVLLPQRFIAYHHSYNLYVTLFRNLYNKYLVDFGAPDIIHAHNAIFGGALALESQNVLKVPFVLTEHTSLNFGQYRKTDYERIILPVLRMSSRNICVSVSLQNALQFHTSIKFDVIPNVVDERFVERRLRSYTHRPSIRFLAVGSLDKNKNHELLLRAFAKAFQGDSSSELVIVGAGTLMTYLRDLASCLGIANVVSFLGHKSREELATIMSESNFFVLPSKIETFGVVVIEALASGLPVIATRCGGPEDIINDKNGRLINVGDLDALVYELKFMRNISKYSRESIRFDALQRFGPSTISNLIQGVYNDVLGSCNARKSSQF